MNGAARRAALLTAGVAGVLVGAVVTMTLTEPGAPQPTSEVEPAPASTSTSAVTATSAPTDVADDSAVLLVWTAGGLPADLADEVRAFDGIEALTMVRGGEARLTGSTDADGAPADVLEPGWHIPIDTLAVDPASFASFVDGRAVDAVTALAPGQALLTQTSARLRGLGEGATIRLADTEVTVVGVIDDLSGAGAELLVSAVDADRLGVGAPRYLLIDHIGDRDALQQAIASRLDGRAVRFRSPAETTWLRHGDAVEPLAVIKSAFGEFAVRDRSGRDVEIDPVWVARWIVTEPVPILGSVTCHRTVVPLLRAAMSELEQANLAHLVDASDFAGCFSPRRISQGQPLSHHAWGAAVDLNVDGNPRGSFSTQDPRLVQALARHGFTWGGTWLVPDPAHYEAPVPVP